jgi:hypothetical protein
MEIDITFSCQCGAFLDELISCDGPDPSSETEKQSECEYWKTIICDGCGKDYDAQIVCSLSDTEVHVPNVVDLRFDVLDSFVPKDIVAEIESTRQIEIYQKVATDVIALLRHDQPQTVRATLNNMLFAQVVTAIEAYLSSSFISTVINDDNLIRRLVETDPELAKSKFSLKEIFTEWEGLKFTVARHLKDLIFHDLKKVKPMYFSVLNIDFGDVSWLFRAILLRHDCVHRNGFDKEGNQQEIRDETITELVKQCTHLVALIEEELLAYKEMQRTPPEDIIFKDSSASI